MLNIAVNILTSAVDDLANIAATFSGERLVAVNKRFNLSLQLVTELKALTIEDFYTVVLIGIMRSGDNDTRIRAAVFRDKSNGGGRHNAKMHNVRSRRAQPRSDG